MTQVHPVINIGLQYIRNTSECIPKLQFHQQNAYGTKAISSGTAYGKQDTGGASKVLLMVNRESALLSIFM